MLTLRKIPPSLSLLPYVRHYEYREILSDDGVTVIPLPARPEQLLQFHLLGRFEVFHYRLGKSLPAPAAVVVGPQTWRVADLLLKGKYLVFVVVFQPTGFHRLFGVPMPELTDRACEASDVIGIDLKLLHDRLRESITLVEMVSLTEKFLLRRMAAPFHPVQSAATGILRRNGQISLNLLVRNSGLSQRQFERKFIQQVGMPPKLYSRIVRLSYALQLKQTRPDLSWTEVTHEAGYFDQTHLVKDFKSLAGDTPSRFFQMIAEAPDRVLQSPPLVLSSRCRFLTSGFGQ
jgi:AraC-like DNA-binding protein